MKEIVSAVNRPFEKFVLSLCLLLLAIPAGAQKKCFSSEARKLAERNARLWHEPDAGYDPVLGYSSVGGARTGAPPSDGEGISAPITCTANPKKEKGPGTTPKFYCSVDGVAGADGKPIRYKIKPQFKGSEKEKRNGEIYGEFLASRFSQAVGFYADDEWVADVTCPDCEKSLTTDFQGVKFEPFQPAAGIEMSLETDPDSDCDDEFYGSLGDSLEKLGGTISLRTQVDAFKIWLAFIDHGDTKGSNQKFSCLKWTSGADEKTFVCEEPIYYISDMGSTFGSTSSSEKKTRLALWKKRPDPLKIVDGKCAATAENVGNPMVSEAGRVLLAAQLQKLLDAENQNKTITRVFQASRNAERDEPAEAWAAEFVRRAKTVVETRCAK